MIVVRVLIVKCRKGENIKYERFVGEMIWRREEKMVVGVGTQKKRQEREMWFRTNST